MWTLPRGGEDFKQKSMARKVLGFPADVKDGMRAVALAHELIASSVAAIWNAAMSESAVGRLRAH